MFSEETETQSCLCVVPFPMCPSVVKVSGDCSSDRALECEVVWTECAQMCCGHVHSFNREERTVVLACLCVLGWNCSPVNWQAEKLQKSQKNCRFLRTVIQGGGPRRPSPKRHRFTGQVRRQRITMTESECSLYTYSTLSRRNKTKKHTKQSPRPGGTHTRHTT